ncbi:MAG: formate dehydrogenase accessory sulfurtransferase FdhD, partial [Synergistaceae bacterium]|nr:formate dehydrogenase accessory sulfurtransferase FdhD [Synergistaceae bacterium]
LSDCVLFTSGRVAADMAEKAVAAGVPVLISKASPTEDAIRLARAYRLTLLCRAREDRYTVFETGL